MAQADVKKQRFVAAAQEFAGCLADWWYDHGGNAPLVLPSPVSIDEGPEPLLNLNEAAKRMRVSVSTFKRKVKAKEIAAVKVTGKASRYRTEDIDRLIRRLK